MRVQVLAPDEDQVRPQQPLGKPYELWLTNYREGPGPCYGVGRPRYLHEGRLKDWQDGSNETIALALRSGLTMLAPREIYVALRSSFESQSVDLPLIRLQINLAAAFLLMSALAIGFAAWFSFLLRTTSRELSWFHFMVGPHMYWEQASESRRAVAAIEVAVSTTVHLGAMITPVLVCCVGLWTLWDTPSTASKWALGVLCVPSFLLTISLLEEYSSLQSSR